MSFNIISSILSWTGIQKKDKTFIVALHEVAEQISGLLDGRKYLVISGGKLNLSCKKSLEVPFNELTKFVHEKLDGLTAEEVTTVKIDLSRIAAECHRQNQVRFEHPMQLFHEQIGFLSLKDSASSAAITCKNWYDKINVDQSVSRAQFRNMTFGPDKWKTYFNADVEEDVPLPQNIFETLDSPCLFYPEKKVAQTHMLVFIPKMVNGVPFTLRMLRELIKNPTDKGRATDFEYIWDQILIDHGDTPNNSSCWVLMTNEPLPNSQGLSYLQQKALATAKPGYDVPNILQAATCILTKYVGTGAIHYGRGDIPVYTRSQQMSGGHWTVVGAFGSSGLFINFRSTDRGEFGVAAIKKLQ